LLALLDRLTPKQRAAIPRLAIHLVNQGSVEALLTGPNRVCARQSYYQRPNGWSHQPVFQEALALAQTEYRQALAGDSVAEVRRLLFDIAPEAIERTIEIMRMVGEPAQSRLAARDLWREVLKAGGLEEEDNDVAITFETPEWAKPETDEPTGD
jgi:hypothetical protein